MERAAMRKKGQHLLTSDENMRMSRADLDIQQVKDTMEKVDIILQAISISHIKEPGTDKCVQNCWACKMEESLKAMDVANRMKG